MKKWDDAHFVVIEPDKAEPDKVERELFNIWKRVIAGFLAIGYCIITVEILVEPTWAAVATAATAVFLFEYAFTKAKP